jgi:hypothetical protein
MLLTSSAIEKQIRRLHICTSNLLKKIMNSKTLSAMKQIMNSLRHAVGKAVMAAPVFIISGTILVGCNKNDGYSDHQPPHSSPPPIKSTVVTASGDINPKLDEFRALLGDSLNTAPGATTGRREINWDGVPAQFTDNNPFPFDFFNSTDAAAPNGRKRGLLYQNTGTAFRVSTNDFSDVDASYGDQFNAFSGNKTFAYMGNNVTNVNFKVAGTNTDAFVKGFGIVFVDIDDDNSTTIEYFAGTKSLGVFKAPKHGGDSPFSFLGAFFPDEKVTSAKITAGNGILGTGVLDISAGGTKDLVVMDDFVYSEPVAN